MKSSQAGGVVSFVVVGVVLAGLLGAGLYFSKHMGREARNAGSDVATVTKNTKESIEETVTGDKTQNSTENKNGTATKPVTPPATSSTQTQKPSASSQPVASTGPSSDIPSTGPTETISTVAALSGVTFAGYVYAGARRGFRSSALKR